MTTISPTMATRDRRDLLVDLLDSMAQLDPLPAELVLVDDGSTIPISFITWWSRCWGCRGAFPLHCVSLAGCSPRRATYFFASPKK